MLALSCFSDQEQKGGPRFSHLWTQRAPEGDLFHRAFISMNVNETLLPPSYLSIKYSGYVTSQQAKRGGIFAYG